MRDRGKIILWPVYFDSTKTRSQGRRVPKKTAVQTPKLSDIEAAVRKLGLECDAVVESAYPRSPWGKIGYVLISRKGSKSNILKRVAEGLLRNHQYL